MKKKFWKIPMISSLVLTLALLIGFKANAAPLKNVPTKIVQPNGEVIQCYASGDEYFNWLHDENGLIIIQDKNTGYYSYAKEVNKKLNPSRNVVSNKAISDKLLNKSPIKGVTIDEVQIPLAEVNKNKDFLKTNSKLSTSPNQGVLNNIIVFIRFEDEGEFISEKSLYNDMFNKSDNNFNSMKNYFKEVSYNKLTVNSTLYPLSNTKTVASYKDIHPRNYYKVKTATNPTGFESPAERLEREHGLLERAIKAIEPQVPKNLNIDMNDDGYVDNVCFVLSGFPEGWNGLLWPHQWSLYSKDVKLNEKKVYLYNFQLEASLLQESGVSTLAHEMFHTLGAPDLYHYAYDGIHPASIWDLMEYNLDPPQHMTAYMKYRYGKWIDSIPEITKDGTYTLKPLQSPTNNAYKIHSPKSETEYFVVEYRKPEGIFEQSLMMASQSVHYNPKRAGIIVYRINTLVDGKGNKEGPPDELYVFRPDGNLKSDGDVHNAHLSKNENRTEIGGKDNSLFLSDGSDSGIYISEIGSADKTISFKVSIKNEPSSASPYMGWIDTLSDNEGLSGVKDISGWFIYGQDISKVEVLVDDVIIGETNRYSRPDIGKIYPNYNTTKAGFSYKLNTTALKNGKHIIKVRATGIDNTTHELESKEVYVKNQLLPYAGWLDTPGDNEIVSGVKDISGWFIYGKEISKIEVLINDKVVGKCGRITRKDVGHAYPGYDVSKAGFVFNFDTTTLPKGSYKLTIRATGIDGTTNDLPSRQIEIKNDTLPYLGWIDSPRNGESVSGVKNIGGWFVYGKAINKIEVLIDDIKVGEATRYSRLDVGTVYPGYDVSKAGFNYSLNTATLKKGSHNIKIRAIGIDKTSHDLELTIIK